MDIARSERKLENSPDAVKAFHSLIYKREYRQRSAVTTGAKKVSAALAFNGEELRKMFSDNVVDERGSTWPIMQVIADIEIHSISVEELGALKLNLSKRFQAINELSKFLSQGERFTPQDLKTFEELVTRHAELWTNLTTKKSRPKAHMLWHCVEFAEKWNFLIPFGENPMESHHASMASTYSKLKNVGQGDHALRELLAAQRIALERSVEIRMGNNELDKRICRTCGLRNTSDALFNECKCGKRKKYNKKSRTPGGQ
jgi:ribosomal protein L40E